MKTDKILNPSAAVAINEIQVVRISDHFAHIIQCNYICVNIIQSSECDNSHRLDKNDCKSCLENCCFLTQKQLIKIREKLKNSS